MSESRAVKVLSKVGLTLGDVSTSLEQATQIVEAVRVQKPELLLGAEIEVGQWLSFSQKTLDAELIVSLNTILTSKSYLVSNKFSIADVAVFAAISENFEALSITTFQAITRWFNHIQKLTVNSSLIAIPRAATIVELSVFASSSAASSNSTETASANDAAPAAAPVAAAKPTDKPAQQKSEKPAAAKEGEKKEVAVKEGKAEKKEKTEKPAKEAAPKEAAAPAAAAELDPSKLDIRVGLVVKCWNHPESDKLLCEEIDLGEGSTRTIASGLRAHYSAEEVQGRKVIVLANLKERPMAGFKSQGMVLCAVNGDHSVVKLLTPPAAAQVGERIAFPGFSGEPAPAAHVAKKKILEGLAPQLKTDASGNAMWNTSLFTLESGLVTSELPDAIVS